MEWKEEETLKRERERERRVGGEIEKREEEEGGGGGKDVGSEVTYLSFPHIFHSHLRLTFTMDLTKVKEKLGVLGES